MTQALRLYNNYDMALEYCLMLDVVAVSSLRRRRRRGRKASRAQNQHSGFVVSAIRVINIDVATEELTSCANSTSGPDDAAFVKQFEARKNRIKNPKGGKCETMAILRWDTDDESPFIGLSFIDWTFPVRSWDVVADWKERLYRMAPY